MSLFLANSFTGHAGNPLTWKIECDALAHTDWDTLGYMAASELLPPFGAVEGIPRGGIKLAIVMKKYAVTTSTRLLIVDDVCTTGTSLEAQRAGRDAIGLVAFSRGNTPWWVTPIFLYAAKGGTPCK